MGWVSNVNTSSNARFAEAIVLQNPTKLNKVGPLMHPFRMLQVQRLL